MSDEDRKRRYVKNTGIAAVVISQTLENESGVDIQDQDGVDIQAAQL